MREPRVAVTDRELGFAHATRMRREIARLAGRLARQLAPAAAVPEAALAQARTFLAAMAAAGDGPIEAGAVPHPLDRLAEAWPLTQAEVDLIVLAVMADAHEGYASVIRGLNPRLEPFATTGLAAQMLCRSDRDRFELRRTLEEGLAVRAGVLSVNGDGPFFERNLAAADGLASVLSGHESYPASASALDAPVATVGLDEWLQSRDVEAARAAMASGDPSVILVVGDSEASAAARAVALADTAGFGWAVFAFGATAAPNADRVALTHALARGAVPIFTVPPGDGPGAPRLPRLEHFPRPVVLCGRRGTIETATHRPVHIVETPPLSASARLRMWRDTLPELADAAGTLAARYALEPGAAADVAHDLRTRRRQQGAAIDLDAVAECVRVRANLPLGAGVKLVRPTATWDQLVLRADRKALLVEALNRLLHQRLVLDEWRFLSGRPGSRGVRVLLSGPPGTGKTLSAEVMAASLGTDLMVVDISRVVSKWIGETEKHLSQAFDAAERSQAILLFDEADALFGKRTEVSDAHDRYANLETAYLLSRLERFEGLAVLSTNLKQNIDPAFMRRVEFAIDFDEPTAIEREALWRCHLPAAAPLDSAVDLQELASLYPMVGGLIRNASVAAGFLAASSGDAIGRHHLIGAIRREYDKSAKAFPGVPPGVVPA